MAHAVIEAVESLRTALDDCRDAAMYALSDAEVVDLLGQVGVLANRLEGQLLVPLVAEVSGRELHKQLGAATPRHVVEGRLRCHPARAGMLVRVAEATANTDAFESTGQALAAGEIGTEHANEVITAVRRLPSSECGSAEKARAAETMLDIARDATPQTVRASAPSLFATVTPEAAARHLERQEERERRRAEESRRLSFHGAGLPGASELRVRIETALMDRLRALLDPLTEPRPIEANGTDTPDTRCRERRGGDAFAELVEAIAAGNFSDGDAPHDDQDAGQSCPDDFAEDTGGPDDPDSPDQDTEEAAVAREIRRRIALSPKRATFLVRLDYDAIADKLGAGLLDTGQPLDTATLARWACEADLVPIWCADGVVPVAVGTTHRFFGGRERQALYARDGGCVFPGCDRPPRFCHGHHIVPFRISRRTSIADGVLLCHFHHRLIHQGAWTIRIASDGLPETIPPPWIDPRQKPRRHVRHQRHPARGP